MFASVVIMFGTKCRLRASEAFVTRQRLPRQFRWSGQGGLGPGRRRRYHWPAGRSPLCMSGVNGGLSYDVDESQLPEEIRPLVQMIVRGPDSPIAFIEAMQQIAEWLWAQQRQANSSDAALPDTLIPFLVDSLGYNNPVAARTAVDLLVRLYGKRAIPTLLQGVAALNYAVNAYALRAMGSIGDADAVFTVAKQCALRGPIPNVRRAAVRCLGLLRYDQAAGGESKRREAIAALSSLLDDPDWTIRYTVVWSLSSFMQKAGNESDLATLLARIAQEDADAVVRARARRALFAQASAPGLSESSSAPKQTEPIR
ncbi:hypothetical protein F1559_003032 [Cyanidiococcus yangmingshanensis]|uniref:HEAT repeat domain-containing protein n=1 Tax=Cyanidiococcus yangmingshanensis TaxID=2690220 RepID=A0A7J7ICC6_9RHOD|nr:hypothetical protein F1559_003032 [Cyanidiococcus yangmingshanensis]